VTDVRLNRGLSAPPALEDVPRETSGAVQTCLIDLGFPCHLACCGCDRTPEESAGYSRARRKMRAAFRARRADVLRLVFFGGDPFALPVSFEDLLGEAAAESQARGIVLEGIALSNGTNWRLDQVHRFASLGVRDYHVALDGPASAHNRSRPAKHGSSFERILNSLRWHRDAAHVELRIDATLSKADRTELLTLLQQEELCRGRNPVTLTFGPRRSCRQYAAWLATAAGPRPRPAPPALTLRLELQHVDASPERLG